MCGMFGLPLFMFIAVDGTAALLSVPTQVWLVATYGEHVLRYLKDFKIVLFSLLVAVAIVCFIRRTKIHKKIFRFFVNQANRLRLVTPSFSAIYQ